MHGSTAPVICVCADRATEFFLLLVIHVRSSVGISHSTPRSTAPPVMCCAFAAVIWPVFGQAFCAQGDACIPAILCCKRTVFVVVCWTVFVGRAFSNVYLYLAGFSVQTLGMVCIDETEYLYMCMLIKHIHPYATRLVYSNVHSRSGRVASDQS